MKKVLSLVLAVVLVVGLGAVAFAARADDHKVETDNIHIAKLGKSGTVGAETSVTFSASPDNKTETYALYEGPDSAPVFFTKEEITKFKIGVQIRASEGSSVISNAKIVYKTITGMGDAKFAHVELNFVANLTSTKAVDYSIKLFPTVNKSRDRNNEFLVSGSYENASQTVDAGDDFVYAADTPVIEAEEYIKNIEVDLGQNVSIFTRMFEGRKYYGRVSQSISADDEVIFGKYPDIDTVYKLDTINLNSTGDTVKFSVGENMFIYVQNADGDLVFLGRSNDRVPYYTKYFLSSKELDIEEVIEVEAPAEEESSGAPELEGVGPTGGDDAPENVNDNPGTGR